MLEMPGCTKELRQRMNLQIYPISNAMLSDDESNHPEALFDGETLKILNGESGINCFNS